MTTENHELAVQEPQELTPMSMLSLALKHSAGIDVIERLAALQEKAQDRDAEMQFNEAMNAAQAELGRIAPDLTNPQTKSRYASYAALDRKLRPIYTKHGFSLSFNSGDSPIPETVRVVCYLSHSGGHTRTYTGPPMPADGKGAKGGDVMTKTHATGAAMSYGARYLLKYIFNIAVGEEDTDGNDEGNVEKGWLEEQIEELGRCESLEGLADAYKAAGRAALAVNDIESYRALTKAKNARKRQLEVM